MTTKHTPAPWTVEGDDIRESKDRCTIATVRCYGTHKLHTEKRANAQLISAAPELLEALELHIAFLDSLNKGWLGKTTGDVGLLNKAYIKGSEALAKAKGEA